MGFYPTLTGSPSLKRHILLVPVLCLLVIIPHCGLFSLSVASAAEKELWLLIDTDKLTLDVMHGDNAVHRFENIAIGSNGSTQDKVIGDEKTPLGDFRIIAIRASQRFHLFLALDYPSSEQVERALGKGLISKKEFHAFKEARERGDSPPVNTRLGGNIGIHGIGNGNLEIHRMVNWTDGCVALTNDQIERLAKEVALGTHVRIR